MDAVPGAWRAEVQGEMRGYSRHVTLRPASRGCNGSAGILVGIVDRDDRTAKNMQLQAAQCD